MNKNRFLVITALIIGVILIFFGLLHGNNIAVLNPKGPIGQQERQLIYFALLLSLIVVLPVFALLFGIAWRYREGNKKAKYTPDWDHNVFIEGIWWLVPSILILILSVVTWNSSHHLDPYRRLASSTKPLTIQVIALDWKWLFIYPEQNIASVNYVKFPTNTPVNFQITADAPMNSFWIPQLGGQIYAMPGMITQLNLMADQAGNYRGSSANISGQGFASMTFTAQAGPKNDFNHWVKDAKKSPNHLNFNTYAALAKPSQYNPATYYSSSTNGLFDAVMLKYMVPSQGLGAQ